MSAMAYPSSTAMVTPMPCLMACLKKTGTFFFLCSIMPMPAFGQRVLTADAGLDCTVLLVRHSMGGLPWSRAHQRSCAVLQTAAASRRQRNY